ncbi:MAG: AAA family ATPase, partial [Pseudomonadota bacterium]
MMFASKPSLDVPVEIPALPATPGEADACDLSGIRIPHISIHVFRETDAFSGTWEDAARDRRMVSATTTVYDGGFIAAIQKYTVEPTPDLIVVETDSTQDILEFETDSLAEVCDAGTELIVIGHRNDIGLYQKLLAMGVSNYMVYPVTVSSIITGINEVYRKPERARIGRIHAVIGAKGGVGASTLAQNLALEIAEASRTEVLLCDLDLCFGTASLNLDVEANQGLRELIDQSDRVDGAMLDRVLVKHGAYLNLLGALPTLMNDRDLDAVRLIDQLTQALVR